MRRLFSIAILLSAAFAGSLAATAAEPTFNDMLARVPSDANALVMIHSAKVRDSAWAAALPEDVRNAWRNVDPHAFANDNIDRIVLGSRLDINTLLPHWEVAVIGTNETPNVQRIVDTFQGTLDNFGTVPAVRLPNNSYFVVLGDRMGGVLYPADRQSVAAWARDSQNASEVELSPYLRAMSEFPEAVGTEIILALDLSNAVSASRIRAELPETETFKDRQGDLDRIADLLASLQGITLGVRVTDGITGALRVDFGKDASILGADAKSAVLEALGDRGVAIDGLSDWSAQVKGNTLFLAGSMDADALRKVLSVIDPPRTPIEHAKMAADVDASAPKTGTREARLEASKKHYDSVQVILADVKKTRDLGTSQLGSWYERYAKKLDQLPILDVDPELLDYTADIADRFRQMSMAFRGIGIRAETKSRGSDSYYAEGYQRGYSMYGGPGAGYYGGSYYREQSYRPSEYTEAMRSGRMNATQFRTQQMAAIDASTNTMRRTMTEKYGVEF